MSSNRVAILIAAMGGEGGGVLADWIVRAAQSAGLAVQLTSIPGVAQRTGATTYYVEMVPPDGTRRSNSAPVLALNPALGEVDIMMATELLEAARAAANGFMSLERTVLIGSTHRVFATSEKMEMGDGRYDSAKLLRVIKDNSRERILFDMEQAAEESGSVLNAVLLGALAGSGRTPVAASHYEAAIREGGKAVDANLAGFAFGLAHARGDLEELAREAAKRAARDAGAEVPLARARAAFAGEALYIVEEGVRRLVHYQDVGYAGRYLDRLEEIRAAGADDRLLREVARHLAVRMSFEDVIRVAQAKVSVERFTRVRREVRAKDHEPVLLTEHFKPGIEEIAAILPPSLGRAFIRWGERTGRLNRTYWSMRVNTTSVLGFVRLWALSKLRWWRPRSLRFVEEQAQIERWLAAIAGAVALSPSLALEIAECARLIKGYGDTHRRGSSNYAAIERAVIAPVLAGTLAPALAADAVASARVAALADPEGTSLSRTLAEIMDRTPALAKAAE